VAIYAPPRCFWWYLAAEVLVLPPPVLSSGLCFLLAADLRRRASWEYPIPALLSNTPAFLYRRCPSAPGERRLLGDKAYSYITSPMNEARLSHLPFWGPSEGFFLINSTAVGLTRMKRSSFGLRVRVNPWVNLGERFIRVNPTDV